MTGAAKRRFESCVGARPGRDLRDMNPHTSLGILLAVMRDTSEPALERYYELLRERTPLARLTTAIGEH